MIKYTDTLNTAKKLLIGKKIKSGTISNVELKEIKPTTWEFFVCVAGSEDKLLLELKDTKYGCFPIYDLSKEEAKEIILAWLTNNNKD